MPSTHLTEYNTLRDNALHTHTQNRSIDGHRCAVACLDSNVQRNMPVRDVIIVSTICRMLRSVAVVVIVVINIR